LRSARGLFLRHPPKLKRCPFFYPQNKSPPVHHSVKDETSPPTPPTPQSFVRHPPLILRVRPMTPPSHTVPLFPSFLLLAKTPVSWWPVSAFPLPPALCTLWVKSTRKTCTRENPPSGSPSLLGPPQQHASPVPPNPRGRPPTPRTMPHKRTCPNTAVFRLQHR